MAHTKEQEEQFKSDKRFELIVEKDEISISALVEENELLKEKVNKLETSNKRLKAENKKLKK